MSTDPAQTPALDEEQARAAVAQALLSIVPDVDVDALGDEDPFRDELELDSLDFLSFVETLSERTGIRIDEEDYRLVSTIGGCVAFLTEG